MSSITPRKVTPFLMFTGCAEEALAFYAGLSEGGFVMMPLSTEYGFSAKYAWLSDRFGVSWQLSLGLGFGGAG